MTAVECPVAASFLGVFCMESEKVEIRIRGRGLSCVGDAKGADRSSVGAWESTDCTRT